MLRGVSGEMLTPLDIEERDLASIQARASQITGMLPMFVMMAVLYGALTAALDSTAGERGGAAHWSRSDEPVPHGALVLASGAPWRCWAWRWQRSPAWASSRRSG